MVGLCVAEELCNLLQKLPKDLKSLILSLWISLERKRLVEVVPYPVRNIWDKWDLRTSLLLSLLCQAILSILGNQRKKSVNKFIYSLVWVAYVTSDWVVNFALGVISNKLGDPMEQCEDHKDDPILLAFWASLLLVHLGCPATITAEALEDNALWPRSLVLWLVQSIRVLYIILLAWKSTWISYLSLPMFVVGFIKCGEKTYALYLACTENSLDMWEESKRSNKSIKYDIFVEGESTNILEMNPRVLFQNFMLFFVSHFVDLVSSYDFLRKHQTNFRRLSPSQAFELVEVQLGYGYDVFYTKASVMYKPWSHIVRNIASSLSYVVIVCFGAIASKMHSLSKMDLIITWILLIGTVVLDYYACSDIALSEWFGNRSTRLLCKVLQHFLPLDQHKEISEMFTFKRKMWSNVITQGNLLSLCLDKKSLAKTMFNKLHKHLETRHSNVDKQLKGYIFDTLVNKSQLPMRRPGSRVYGVSDCIDSEGPKSIDWTKYLEFQQIILVWHIATDICYYDGIGDIKDEQHLVADTKLLRISKNISDYMLYILVKQRKMLPVGKGLVSFGDTCGETMELLRELNIETQSINNINMTDVCQKLRHAKVGSTKSRHSNSVLLDACRLGSILIDEMEIEKRCKLLASVWVEVLTYAATHCVANQHAQQLRKGGEFLTHVWLLSAHIGVMEQFHVTSALTDPLEQELPSNQISQCADGITAV